MTALLTRESFAVKYINERFKILVFLVIFFSVV